MVNNEIGNDRVFSNYYLSARFQINLGRLKNRTSLSNMPKISEGVSMKNNSDYVWDIYKTTPIMSTYTIAMAVLSQDYTFSVKQVEKRNISVVSMFYDNETTEELLTNTDNYLRFFEKYFNDTDELPKIDNLHSIDGAYGAMENWGLIVYFGSNGGQKLIAHEVAHYWHGNKVTCSNWHE